jgi:hypothetical protein
VRLALKARCQNDTNELRKIAHLEFAHRDGAMALIGPWTDVQESCALFVGSAVADQLDHLALAGVRLCNWAANKAIGWFAGGVNC